MQGLLFRYFARLRREECGISILRIPRPGALETDGETRTLPPLADEQPQHHL
jgi:hypothetical protein